MNIKNTPRFAAAIFACGVLAVHAAGFDGMNLVTNDWFDASFTALVEDTAVAQGGALGVTRGAGSWTSVPENGTATVVADADAGGGATCLSLRAPREALTFTPAPFAVTSGMETVSMEFKADAFDADLPVLDADVQTAFTILDDGMGAVPVGYVADGWTNLVYSGAMTDLTNAWFTLTVDFATVAGVRYVRYSVKPAAGARTILADASGTTWFQAAANAETLNSVSFSGTGEFRTFGGDSLQAANVASYNGIGYTSVAAAIAAGVADGWANGNVMLLADAAWSPSAAGTYNIDVSTFSLDVTATEYTLTVDTVAGTVTATRTYTWAGSVDTWLSAANWTVGNDAHVATTYPGEVTTEPFTVVFAKNATFTSAETVDISGRTMDVEADGFSVKLPNLTVTPGEDNNPATITRLVSGTFRFSNYNRHRVMVEDGATLIIDQNVSGSSTYYNWFKGTGTIVVDGVTINGTQGYGSVVRGFNGTFKLANGAKLITTSNNSDTFIGTGKFVFAGGTVQKDATYGKTNHAFGSSSVDVVAATTNNCDMPVPLNKVTVVSGSAILDADEQYVVLTARTSTTGVLPDNAVDATLAAADWGVLQSTNEAGQAILVLTHSPTYTWTGAAGDNLWATPENWIVGDYVPAAAPGEGDVVSITTAEESLEVVVADGQNVGTLTKGENVSLVGPGPYSATVTEGVVSLVRVPSTFVWTGALNSNWTATENWTVNGRSTDVLPGVDDTVLFPELAENASAWQVNLSTTPTVTNVTANGAVTLTGALIRTATVEGSATITLGDSAGFRTYDYIGAEMTISANIEANGTAEHPNEIRGYYTTKGGSPDQGGTRITFSGDLTGTGTLKIIGCRCTNVLSGDLMSFAGHLWIVDDRKPRNNAYLESANTTSSNAIWTVYNDGNAGQFLKFGGQTVYFGALNGTVYQSSSFYNNVFEIGARNVDCAFGGKIGATKQNHITKVGTATLSFSGSDMGILTVKGGVFAAVNEASFPMTSITFDGEGGLFDPTTNTVDFAAKLVNSTTAPIGLLITNNVTIGEIPASNTAGLVKKGEGTLTLSAAPLYTGDTYLDGGTLKIVKSAGVKVKTHADGKAVYKTSETIEGVEYTVYELGVILGTQVIFF
jgi:autotransporter-associated beta strand protein